MNQTKRLAKADRRQQLLETARHVIGREGTEALTLGHLAEQAGVSKPIAYEHFGTRAGLLIALCDDYNDRQLAAQTRVLDAGGDSVDAVAQIFASTYVGCVLDMGPEMGATFAALAATEETAAFRQALRDGYVERYRRAFGRLIDLDSAMAGALYKGLLGAAEALAQDAATGRLTREEAVAALTRIFSTTLKPYEKRSA
ncbi:MAG TPA: TetR/AcrR family transcriptional regulator [Mesorhizobium sp.]|jgi:AcrR family transcriptional regulator|uniref:TetR/AcrR family transcriptional regulator n=1 Tax=Mesorhizobium sp. TaxID=1871066 RepID=UPI002DDCD959|nr:TetR/AcrR family transcriptional regulator [Mesorhizobium sp.]HEV2505563.1 TetR/AcrR family transcriptional regulator [Mesorhizobium sp.]